MSRILTVARIVWLEMLRRKDFYVLLILMGVMLFVLLSVNIFGLGGVVRYVLDVGMLLTWLCSLILAINITGRQLPTEESRGTIYPLLAKPVNRMELLLGKWLGVWTAVGLATLVFYLVLLAVYLLRGGEISAETMAQAVILHLAALGMICALVLALSTRMTYGASSTLGFVIILASYLLVPRIPWILTQAQGISGVGLRIIYYLLPHFELFDMRQRVVHNWDSLAGQVGWSTVFWIFLYAVLFTCIFILLAWLGYRNKRFKRSDLV